MYHKILLASVCAFAITSAANAEVILNRGNDMDPATLDPHHTATVPESRILADLYDGLVRQSAKGETVAATAQSWEISQDGIIYTLHLRDDAKWSNGDKVTAGDFLFAFRRIMNPKTAANYANVLFPIKNAEM